METAVDHPSEVSPPNEKQLIKLEGISKSLPCGGTADAVGVSTGEAVFGLLFPSFFFFFLSLPSLSFFLSLFSFFSLVASFCSVTLISAVGAVSGF